MLKSPIGFIFYSFEVLISTIELQSISFIRPLVMKIDYDVCLVTHSSSAVPPYQSIKVDSGVWYQSWLRWGSASQYNDVSYLHHQWSDEADTLQLGSTDEYFETVEYEPDRTLEHRDILWKPPNLEIF